MNSTRFRAMNTEVVLAGEGEPGELERGFRQAEEFVHESESRFSRFLESSELSLLNRSAGKWFSASRELFSLISLAQRFFHLTRGLFDPSILPDLRRVGYDRSMDQVREDGAGPLMEYMLSSKRASFSEVDLDEEKRQVHLPEGMQVDLGGIAKGWIAEEAAVLLAEHVSTCGVNAGGDMFLVGLPEGSETWSVELEDPLKPENILTRLAVPPGGLATSTITKRTWKQGALNRHHLIDPRSGEPAETEWLSVTVTATHAYEAEVFAKALLIGGPAEAGDIVRNSVIPFSYLAVDRDRQVWSNQISLEASHVH